MSAFAQAMYCQLEHPDRDERFRIHIVGQRPMDCACRDFIYLRSEEQSLIHTCLAGRQEPRVLDIGCGIGRHSAFARLLSPGAIITVVEADQWLRDYCLSAVPGAIDYEEFNDVPDDARFDVVFLMGNGLGIFGSEDTTRQQLQWLHMLVADGGSMLIESGNPFSHVGYFAAQQQIEYDGSEDEPFIWGYATRIWLQNELDRVGFAAASATPSRWGRRFSICHFKKKVQVGHGSIPTPSPGGSERTQRGRDSTFDGERRCSMELQLKELFAGEVKPLLQSGDAAGLERLYWRWYHGVSMTKEMEQFNRYDIYNPTKNPYLAGGKVWTARMLEYCRDGRELRFIETGRWNVNFALLAMELTLGIPSRKNVFRPGRRERIQPDGLGIRRNGSLCIIENKASESEDLLDTTLQALCGALAVYAKRDMIVNIARHGVRRRPAAPNVNIPTGLPSIGLYILTHHERYRRVSDGRLLRELDLIRGAFEFVREIAYFSVDPERDFPGRIPVDQVIGETRVADWPS